MTTLVLQTMKELAISDMRTHAIRKQRQQAWHFSKEAESAEESNYWRGVYLKLTAELQTTGEV